MDMDLLCIQINEPSCMLDSRWGSPISPTRWEVTCINAGQSSDQKLCVPSGNPKISHLGLFVVFIDQSDGCNQCSEGHRLVHLIKSNELHRQDMSCMTRV